MSTITDRIEELLEQNGLSKKEMLARVGVTASAFSQWKLEQILCETKKDPDRL